ncbi:MAG TPA: 6-phosphogluconolactonase [Verrucomicrobiae bacterium]|jgi:6-phosphogluconolactonase|nr:6-phosphogluconolactonase [Verrucomicrobiae bacterium]
MKPDIRTFPDPASLAKAAAADWLALLAERAKGPAALEPYAVALSGGRIARDFFSETVRQATASQNVKHQYLFDNVDFFWADERCVPPSDPESNYRIASELLFEPLQIAAGHIHRIRGEENEPLALGDAVGNILAVAPSETNGGPLLPLVFLGMGEDGHVASLFPGEPPQATAGTEVYRAVTAAKPPPRRITLGYGVLAAAGQVWVLASGKGKEQALRESLATQGKTPLARVLRSRSDRETRIYTDVIAG